MLQGIFNYDNPAWRFIGKLGDLTILNILWIVCSIPVFTAGASATAVYYVTLKLVRNEDDSTIRSFSRSLKSNFKQTTVIWLILLATGVVLGLDFQFFVPGQIPINDAVKTATTAVSGGLLLIYLFTITYMFPLQVRFCNPVKRTPLNAFLMSVRHLFRTTGTLAADLGIVATTHFGLFCFPQFAMLLSLFGMPLITFVNLYFFTVVFEKYVPKEEQNHTGATPLPDEEGEEMKKATRNLKGK